MINKAIITVHKTKFEFRFGMGFLGRLLKRLDLDIEGVMNEVSKNPFEAVPIIMHVSAEYGFYRNKKECKHTVDDFIDYIDADGGIQSKSVEKFLNAFMSSMTEDLPVVEDTPVKKTKAPRKS